MPILLDTNALLWSVDDDVRLGPRARRAIDDGREAVVSVVSLWEVAIKAAVGKLTPPPDLSGMVDRSGARRLAIEDAHLVRFTALPMIHRDPFDRMLIAQAQAEGLTIITSDEVFGRYGAAVLDARG